jgi:nickel transport protein
MPEKWLRWTPHLPALFVQGILLVLVIAAGATPALAHRVLVFAYAEGDTIHTESKFVPDTPVRQGKIEVMDKQTGKALLTGQTDDQGKFSFKIPAAAAAQKLDLEIVVEAAMGHRGSWLLKANSYLPGATPGQAVAPPPATPVSATVPLAPATKTANVDPQALEAVLNKALEQKLAPLNAKLTDLTIHRTSLPDVLGGIGYIFGLFGLWAYFQSTRKKNS